MTEPSRTTVSLTEDRQQIDYDAVLSDGLRKEFEGVRQWRPGWIVTKALVRGKSSS